uniref:Uncharacterized protein n=1 Tax=Mus musculus TaxID=10090 RepID=Q3UXB5_MOUSE|nr:unnamed protein product [Mus musculus]
MSARETLSAPDEFSDYWGNRGKGDNASIWRNQLYNTDCSRLEKPKIILKIFLNYQYTSQAMILNQYCWCAGIADMCHYIQHSTWVLGIELGSSDLHGCYDAITMCLS